MTDPIRDPEESETQHLHEVARLRHARVLEVGSGDGRLTWRYAGLADRVVAIDIAADQLANARRDCPPSLARTVSVARAEARALPFRDQSFDVVLLAWSL